MNIHHTYIITKNKTEFTLVLLSNFNSFSLAGATGIEPISTVLETAILTVVLRPFLLNILPFYHKW